MSEIVGSRKGAKSDLLKHTFLRAGYFLWIKGTDISENAIVYVYFLFSSLQFNLDMDFYMVKPDFTSKKIKVGDLLPMAFTPASLKEERV